MTKKQQARLRAIMRQLAALRERGADSNNHPDVEILEAERDRLGELFLNDQSSN